jgi:hypothetical protein
MLAPARQAIKRWKIPRLPPSEAVFSQPARDLSDELDLVEVHAERFIAVLASMGFK